MSIKPLQSLGVKIRATLLRLLIVTVTCSYMLTEYFDKKIFLHAALCKTKRIAPAKCSSPLGPRQNLNSKQIQFAPNQKLLKYCC